MEKQIEAKQNKKVLILAIILILSISGLLTGGYLYFNQIIKVEDINLEIRQAQKVELPKTIPVILRSKAVKQEEVEWEHSNIDESFTGRANIKGTVRGFSKSVTAHINVYPYITKIGEEGQKIIQGEEIVLPEKVSAVLSNLDIRRLKVEWDSSSYDVNTPGKYSIEGKVSTVDDVSPIIIDKDIKAVYNLEVISKEEFVNGIFVKNQYSNTPEFNTSMEAVEALPVKVLTKLSASHVRIDFVDRIKSPLDGSGLHAAGEVMFEKGEIQIVYAKERDLPKTLWDEYHDYVTTLHEIGHVYDAYTLSSDKPFSDSTDFKDAYDKEKSNIFNSSFSSSKAYREYYLNQWDEYFAECFAYYFKDEKTSAMLKEKAPLTYQCIDKSINDN
ncbi:MAG: Ig-like domain-containing protein [Bacillota bacterium]|nr:Ig-like domain-containing protein [Bacillota bacterium]